MCKGMPAHQCYAANQTHDGYFKHSTRLLRLSTTAHRLWYVDHPVTADKMHEVSNTVRDFKATGGTTQSQCIATKQHIVSCILFRCSLGRVCMIVIILLCVAEADLTIVFLHAGPVFEWQPQSDREQLLRCNPQLPALSVHPPSKLLCLCTLEESCCAMAVTGCGFAAISVQLEQILYGAPAVITCSVWNFGRVATSCTA